MNAIRPCPICGNSRERRVLYRQRFCEGVLGDGYDVVCCSNCGAGFADGIPTQAELDEYYSTQSKYSIEAAVVQDSPYERRRFLSTVDWLDPIIPSHQSKILDVGCATGGLLSVFKERGYQNLIGADPSESCALAARMIHGIDVRAAAISELRAWTDRFDIILLVGVLEHLRDVRPALESVASLLNVGGQLYVAVPDMEGLAGCRNAPFQQFSMEHVNFFTRKSLNNQLANLGFSPMNTWRSVVEWREGVTETTLGSLYATAGEKTHTYDDVSKASLLEYIRDSAAVDQRLEAQISVIANGREPIVVWGAGALTRRLLSATSLGRAEIVCFADSSALLQGKRLNGRMICSPAELRNQSERILIASVAFEKEILKAIRETYCLGNPVITLAI